MDEPYSYTRTGGGLWCVYKKTNNNGATKVAQIMILGDEGKKEAAFMVAALNSRARFLNKNKQS